MIKSLTRVLLPRLFRFVFVSLFVCSLPIDRHEFVHSFDRLSVQPFIHTMIYTYQYIHKVNTLCLAILVRSLIAHSMTKHIWIHGKLILFPFHIMHEALWRNIWENAHPRLNENPAPKLFWLSMLFAFFIHHLPEKYSVDVSPWTMVAEMQIRVKIRATSAAEDIISKKTKLLVPVKCRVKSSDNKA